MHDVPSGHDVPVSCHALEHIIIMQHAYMSMSRLLRRGCLLTDREGSSAVLTA